MWWIYFHRTAASAEKRLLTHDDPVLTAADAYSYLHLIVVAGIIVFAVGIKEAIALPAAPLPVASRLALCGGVSLYLGGITTFRGRMLGDVRITTLLGAALPLVVFALSSGWAAVWVLAVTVLVLAALSALENLERHPSGALT